MSLRLSLRLSLNLSLSAPELCLSLSLSLRRVDPIVDLARACSCDPPRDTAA